MYNVLYDLFLLSTTLSVARVMYLLVVLTVDEQELKVLLISDAKTDKSAAALDVSVGSALLYVLPFLRK